jgi:hypothetical protein
MGKIIRLTESDLLKIVKKVIKESALSPEPMLTGADCVAAVHFSENEVTVSPSSKGEITEFIKTCLTTSLQTILRFQPDNQRFTGSYFPIPTIIELYAGTSSTGSDEVNAKKGQGRLIALENIAKQALRDLKLSETTILRVLTTNTTKTYRPSEIDRHINRKTTRPDPNERICYIKVNEVTTRGLSKQKVGTLAMLLDTYGDQFDVPEDKIVNVIKILQSYSDIEELNEYLANTEHGNLENFINNTIQDGLTPFGSDTKERIEIVNHLNTISNNFGMGNIANIINKYGIISLTLNKRKTSGDEIYGNMRK